MDRFRSLEVFAATAERLSFAAAARDLKLTRAMVSKHIADLEARLGVRLFHRTTRRANLTEAGRALAERAGHAHRRGERNRRRGARPANRAEGPLARERAGFVRRRASGAVDRALPRRQPRRRDRSHAERSRRRPGGRGLRHRHPHRRAGRLKPDRAPPGARAADDRRLARVPAAQRHAEDAGRSEAPQLPRLRLLVAARRVARDHATRQSSSA